MGYRVLVIRSGDMALLAGDAGSWHPTEDRDLVGDAKELAIELDLHVPGWRMCQCYSRYEPDGEFGHIAEDRRLAIRRPTSRKRCGYFSSATCRNTRSASTTRWRVRTEHCPMRKDPCGNLTALSRAFLPATRRSASETNAPRAD